jgi:predicted ATPase/class 3 adenylate cyclase/DNA-binding CsgD family transcriptional regulator
MIEPPTFSRKPPTAALPTGTVTFLLTDMEASTRLWQQYHEAMRLALVRHDTLIDQVVTEHDGQLVRPRGEGDSRFAVFARASDAVSAACAIQLALTEEPWGLPEPVRVRIGVHTGEADLQSGDYYGPAANHCARLRSLAHGGQVLVSAVTADLVREAPPTQSHLRDLGEHLLKDLLEPERIWQVVHPGLKADFPPLSSPSHGHDDLPSQMSSFIGRQRELREVRSLIETARLVTLTGSGGIGKTRLAQAVAADISTSFEHGVASVSLAPIRDPNAVLSAIASAFGQRDEGVRPLVTLVREYLKDKRLLLLLDNFEQVADAASLLPDLLAAAPGVKVLATSRAVLQVTGEHEYPLMPLALPDQARTAAPDELAQVASVRLFVERARAASPDFALTAQNATSVAAVCLHLDGLPLAIELAAARVRVLPPEALLDRLKRDGRQRVVHLLTGGARDVPPRQQTLRATIDWSYDLLSKAEQAVFRSLGVFAGAFTLDDAEAVLCTLVPPPLASDNRLDVLEHIEGLVNKSLLQSAPRGGPRFHMLETIREYAAERLEAHGEDASARRAHAQAYLGLAERAEPRLFSSEASPWIERLEIEHDNLRAALQWVLGSGEPDLGVRLTAALWHFWYVRGHLREGGLWLERALAAWQRMDSGSSTDSALVQHQETVALAKALGGAGILAHYRAEYRLAAGLSGEALAVSRRLGDPACIAIALDGLALVARAGHNYPAARAMYQEATEIREALGDTWGLSYTLRYLATALWLEADFAAARPVAERALALARDLGDQQGITTALTVLSFATCGQGDNVTAEALVMRALALLEGFPDRRGTARAHWGLANAIVLAGRYAEACSHYQVALTISREISDQWFGPWCLLGLAHVAVHAGDAPRAVRLVAAQSALEGGLVAPCLQPQVAQTLTSARAMMDESTWEAAQATGRQLSYDEAADEALAIECRARAAPTLPSAARTGRPLTARELQVATLVARGLTNKQIAAELVIAEGTADRHVANILSRLEFASRAQIGAWVATNVPFPT